MPASSNLAIIAANAAGAVKSMRRALSMVADDVGDLSVNYVDKAVVAQLEAMNDELLALDKNFERMADTLNRIARLP